jgi:uncharacterized protein
MAFVCGECGISLVYRWHVKSVMNGSTPIQTQIDILEPDIIAFCQRWKIARLELFGSVLRNDFRPDSDVDVLFSFLDGAKISLDDYLEMERELEVIM